MLRICTGIARFALKWLLGFALDALWTGAVGWQQAGARSVAYLFGRPHKLPGVQVSLSQASSEKTALATSSVMSATISLRMAFALSNAPSVAASKAAHVALWWSRQSSSLPAQRAGEETQTRCGCRWRLSLNRQVLKGSLAVRGHTG